MNFRFADPEYVNFVPSTAMEAVLKFRRLQKQGLSPARYPEALIECASALNDEEMGKFEEWIFCPQGKPGKECLEVTVFSKDNARVHAELVAAQEDDEKSEEYEKSN